MPVFAVRLLSILRRRTYFASSPFPAFPTRTFAASTTFLSQHLIDARQRMPVFAMSLPGSPAHVLCVRARLHVQWICARTNAAYAVIQFVTIWHSPYQALIRESMSQLGAGVWRSSTMRSVPLAVHRADPKPTSCHWARAQLRPELLRQPRVQEFNSHTSPSLRDGTACTAHRALV